MAAALRETDLYAPIKALLESQGYEVKAEVGAADIVAVKDGAPPVIVEMKTGFSLALFHQAVERLKLTDTVYVAVPEWKGRTGWKAFRQNLTLCRRLGLGAITVHDGAAQVHLDPVPYKPRQSKARRERLLGEFQRRVGDPNTGGSTRRPLVTAYRQDALKCVKVLLATGPSKAADVARSAGVETARRIMADDHYGWFERVKTGIYQLSPKGRAASDDYRPELSRLDIADTAADSSAGQD